MAQVQSLKQDLLIFIIFARDYFQNIIHIASEGNADFSKDIGCHVSIIPHFL